MCIFKKTDTVNSLYIIFEKKSSWRTSQRVEIKKLHHKQEHIKQTEGYVN